MKTKIILFLFISVSLIIFIGVKAVAKPNTTLVPATNEKSDVSVVIPQNAVEVAPGIFSLGTVSIDEKVVEGYMIIHYKEDFTHRPGHHGDKGGKSPSCFAFLSKGAKWKTIEPWIVNTENTRGLDNNFIFTNIAADIQKWEDASLTNVLGDGNVTIDVLSADTVNPDDKNEVYFSNIDSQGAIAVTIVWGIFSGPPSIRELVEWDQVYDQVDFDWSSSGEADKMDFENVATHEIGHSVGMGHPDDSCIEETMYRFTTFGETKKRTLNSGDILGINELY